MTTMSATRRLPTHVESGIRPFDIGRDLRPVAELIANAFSQELDPRGTAALREMRIMSYMGGVLKLLNRSTGEFDDVFSGFVWVENNKVVGNVTVQRADHYGNRWQIANVAVSPEFRGRGIAGRLMRQALDHVYQSGGQWAVLQVYQNNAVALNLYERMGFENMGGAVDLLLDRVGLTLFPERIPNFYSFSPSRWQALYELANSQHSAQAKWWRSMRRSDFQLSLEQQVNEWFWRVMGRRRIYRRSLQTSTRRFEAAIILTAERWRGTHAIQLWARPEHHGRYEHTLIQWALATLQEFPRWPVSVRLSIEHEAAIEALRHFGFKQQQTLLTMRLNVKE